MTLRGTFCLFCSVAVSCLDAGQAAPQTGKPTPEYRGLKIGTARADDVKRLLGEPTRIDKFPGSGDHDLVYLNPELGIEQITVGVRHSVLLNIDIEPIDLNPSDAIKRFGSGYRTVRYNFDNCESDGESTPLYEDPEGGVEYIEYRQRGIFLLIAYAPYRVQAIIYQRDPPGSPKSRCTEKGVQPQSKAR